MNNQIVVRSIAFKYVLRTYNAFSFKLLIYDGWIHKSVYRLSHKNKYFDSYLPKAIALGIASFLPVILRQSTKNLSKFINISMHMIITCVSNFWQLIWNFQTEPQTKLNSIILFRFVSTVDSSGKQNCNSHFLLKGFPLYARS